MDRWPEIAKVALAYVAVLLVIFGAVAVWHPVRGARQATAASSTSESGELPRKFWSSRG